MMQAWGTGQGDACGPFGCLGGSWSYLGAEGQE